MRRTAIRRTDAARILAETETRALEVVPARLGPVLFALSRRCGGKWTDAEQAEWAESVEQALGELQAQALHAIRATAVPAGPDELDS